ncbi:leucine-rich melanocyte differentiation-associated protein isoform X4 [Ursus arctos]|uniref:leucine-rich melanocyte differentiation-associated protein isoform X4 n=1 Tax=Ursus arctos TaxID=9644 RepID=UPI00254727EA|nr:leucine-rich melanocyte differentiation-associated protein isoform X4 [Ursus arctos]
MGEVKVRPFGVSAGRRGPPVAARGGGVPRLTGARAGRAEAAGAQLSPGPSTRPAPRASAGSADYLVRNCAPGAAARRRRALRLVLRSRCSAPRVRPVVMAGLVVSGTQVSYIGQDCREIPEHLGRDCGHFAKRLDLSFNLLSIMELLLLARAEQNTSSVIQSSQPHLQWDCYYTQFTDEATETQMGEEVCSRLPGWFNERERSKWPWGFDFIFIVTPNCFLRYNLLLLVCEKMGSLFQVYISLLREKVSFFFENPEQPAEATIVGSQWILQLRIGDPVGFRVLSVAFLFCVAKTLIGKCWVCRTSL